MDLEQLSDERLDEMVDAARAGSGPAWMRELAAVLSYHADVERADLHGAWPADAHAADARADAVVAAAAGAARAHHDDGDTTVVPLDARRSRRVKVAVAAAAVVLLNAPSLAADEMPLVARGAEFIADLVRPVTGSTDIEDGGGVPKSFTVSTSPSTAPPSTGTVPTTTPADPGESEQAPTPITEPAGDDTGTTVPPPVDGEPEFYGTEVEVKPVTPVDPESQLGDPPTLDEGDAPAEEACAGGADCADDGSGEGPGEGDEAGAGDGPAGAPAPTTPGPGRSGDDTSPEGTAGTVPAP